MEEQRAIVAFLDRETARIDALLEKKKRLIELLQEKRAAAISQAVTRGLDPTAPSRDSGVVWLGECPTHWKVLRLRSLTTSHKQGYYTEETYVDQGVRLARITDIDDDARVSFHSMPFVEIGPKEERAFDVRDGDFLFARSGTIGRFGVVREPERAVFASYLIRFRFRGVDLEFLRYALLSRFVQQSLRARLHGGANQNVHAEDIKECVVLVPPIAEQRSITRELDEQTRKVDQVVGALRAHMDRLSELRSAAISAAVTGKIDVRGEVA